MSAWFPPNFWSDLWHSAPVVGRNRHRKNRRRDCSCWRCCYCCRSCWVVCSFFDERCCRSCCFQNVKTALSASGVVIHVFIVDVDATSPRLCAPTFMDLIQSPKISNLFKMASKIEEACRKQKNSWPKAKDSCQLLLPDPKNLMIILSKRHKAIHLLFFGKKNHNLMARSIIT